MNLFAKASMALTAAAFLATAASAGQLTVETNKTKPLKLKHAASSVVVGNPNVADVAVHDERLVFITGKTFGTTNLMIFNDEGKQIYAADIVVTTNTANQVVVNRGGLNRTYSCDGECRPVLNIGDEKDFFEYVDEQHEALTE